jgi:hypothetical protein
MMKNGLFVLGAAGAIVAGSVLATAQNPPAAPAQGGGRGPAAPMTFFVTSVGVGNGANLGGLAGADAHCAKLAAASGAEGAAGRTWHAYLSTQGPNAVNARDRIGNGPWANSRGGIVARNLSHLHGDTLEEAQMGSNLTKTTALTEKGGMINGAGGPQGVPNEHDILTGSKPDGRAYTDTADHTCNNYTSGADGSGSVQLGHFDRTGGGNASWNSAHGSRGCSQPNLVSTGGAGYFYCFAVN